MMAENRLVQYLAMLSGSLLPFSAGLNQGWPAPYLPRLQSPNESNLLLTSNEVSWCAVMPLLGGPLGALFGANLVDRMGRKNLLLLQAPIIIACFVTMAYANNIYMLCLPRFLMGSTEAVIYTALPIYLGEISDPAIRGVLGSSTSVAEYIGAFCINIIGPFTSIFQSSILCTAFPIIHLLTFIWMPESPYYLIKMGANAKAKISLEKLRGTYSDAEYEEIINAVKRQEAGNKSSFLDLVRIKSNRKALYIYLILSFTNKISGMTPLFYYTTSIFQSADGLLDPVTSTILFYLAGVCSTILALFVIDRFGRRPLMLFSASGCALALSCEALYFTLKIFQPDLLAYLSWLPIVGLLGFNIIFNVGLAFGPVLCLSEFFPTAVKANALALAEIVAVSFGTVTTKFFHILTGTFGMYVPFWCFAFCTFLGFCLIYRKVPETKGKTLEEIQLELIGASKIAEKS